MTLIGKVVRIERETKRDITGVVTQEFDGHYTVLVNYSDPDINVEYCVIASRIKVLSPKEETLYYLTGNDQCLC